MKTVNNQLNLVGGILVATRKGASMVYRSVEWALSIVDITEPPREGSTRRPCMHFTGEEFF